MRNSRTILFILTLGLHLPAFAASPTAKVYKNPNCGCCKIYAQHLEASGIDIEIIDTTGMSSVKQKYGVPEKLEGCHTTVIGPYVFEGMIPAKYIQRVLDDRPIIRGLSLPGMPVGVPGMPGKQQGTLHIYYISAQKNPVVFASF